MTHKSRQFSSPTMHSRQAQTIHSFHKLMAVAVALLLLSVGLPQSASAGDSVLDPTFNRDGKQTTNFSGKSDQINDIVLQPDGKIVAVGATRTLFKRSDFALARYNTDGSLDSSFGTGGKVTTNFDILGSEDVATALALQPDGKIVAVGYTTDAFAIARYHSNGSLDQGFGNGGKVIHPILGQISRANDVVIQPDGKIVVAGYTYHPNTERDFALARYHPDGSLDTSFDGDGVAITDVVTFNRDMVTAIALQPDGKIVAVGSGGGSDSSVFALARYKPNGALDPTFGVGGKLTTSFSPPGAKEVAMAVTIQPDGRIVAAGFSQDDPFFNSRSDIAIARYKRNGRLDDSFGTGGRLTTDFFGQSDAAYDMVLQPDGKIVVAGKITEPPQASEFGIVRYNKDGGIDTTFYNAGNLMTDFFCGGSSANAIVLQPDGKIVAAGLAGGGEFSYFALARYRAQVISATPQLLSLRLSLPKVAGCQTLTGTVTLSASAPAGGLDVALTDSNPAASVPSSVTVPAGETSACFAITTTPVKSVRTGSVVASLNGVRRVSTLVVRPVGVKLLELDQDAVTYPDFTYGHVTLECPAPAGGLIVTIKSSNPAVASPDLDTENVFFPEGQSELSFGISIAQVPRLRRVTITATANGIAQAAVLTVY